MKAPCLLGFLVWGAVTGTALAADASALFSAVWSRNVAAAQIQVKKGGDVAARDNQGRSVLFIAAQNGDASMVRYLLTRKPDLDARTLLGETPLHAAALAGDARTVTLLLNAGASPRVYTKSCLAPLDYAAGMERKGVFQLLKSATSKVRLPADGTVEECRLSAELRDFATTQAAFYARTLRLESADDYAVAAQSLEFLADNPKVGERFVAEIVRALDQPSLPGTEAKGFYDDMFRRGVVDALIAIARTKPLKDRVAKDLLRLVARGPCSVYTATTCRDLASCDPLGDSKLLSVAKVFLKRQESWPRTEGDEACYNCAHCAETRVGHAYDSALAWFAANPSYRPQVEAVMARQVKAKLLGSTEMKQKKRLLTPQPER